MRTVGSSTLRGGQTVFHGLRMWGQLLRAGVFVAAAAVVAVPGWHIWHYTSGYDWYAAGIVTVAEAKVAFGYRETAMQEVRMRDGRTRVLAVTEIAASPEALAIRKRLRNEVFASAVLGAKASGVVIVLFLALFQYRGYQLNRAKRLRGAELATASQLARRIRPVGARLRKFSRAAAPAPYRIAGVPFPARTETQHTIVSGTTGSGKTVLISDLVAQIRDKGERCVVYDKMGSYTRAFFDPARDMLLNPLDARAPRWSPFFEARSLRDFDTMAAALVPQQKDTVDPFWVTAARQLFSNGAGVLWKKGITENKVLVDHLLKTELTALAQAMEGTVAQSIVDPGEPEDRAQRARHADRASGRAGAAARYRHAVLDPGLDRTGGPGGVPVPDLARRPACEPAGSYLDLARDRRERALVARTGRRAAGSGSSSTSCRPCTRCRRSSPASPNRASSAAASCSGSRSSRRCATSTGATAPRPSRGSAAPAWCSRRRTATPPSGRPTASGAPRSRRSPRASPTAPTPSATASR